MRKNLKVIMIFALLIISTFVFYYVAIFIPQQKKIQISRNEEIRNWQIKCENYGKEKYGDTAELSGDIVIERWYGFSATLNTCVAIIEVNNLKSGLQGNSLIDMFKENKIYVYDSSCSKNLIDAGYTLNEIEKECPSLDNFDKKKKEVLGE